jgi:hypothetical protein
MKIRACPPLIRGRSPGNWGLISPRLADYDGHLTRHRFGDQCGEPTAIATAPVSAVPEATAVTNDGSRGYVADVETGDVHVLSWGQTRLWGAIKVGVRIRFAR